LETLGGSAASSTILFDHSGDGVRDGTAWLNGDDAWLALDRDGDGRITTGAEISFTQDLPGAQTDLEGLAAYDSNNNGYFDAGDARYGDFRVWQDANQDGVSQADELRTLADHDIRAINLTRTPTGAIATEDTSNAIVATSEFVRNDGSLGGVGDVSLGYIGKKTTVQIVDAAPDVDVNRTADDHPAADSAAAASAANEANGRLRAQMSSAGDRDDNAIAGVRSPDQNNRESDAEFAARQRRLRDWARSSQENLRAQDDEFAVDGDVTAAPSALHASLDLVSQRRLQMIEAMAGFTPDSGASLELRPQRRIDAKTYELRTAVSLTGPGSA
jgi:hypothetical protein